MPQIDAYATLGVAHDAPDFVIQAAYRACLKRYHPDHYKGEDARQRTEDVLEAFRLIGNDASRADYDRSQHKMGAPDGATDTRGQTSPPPPPHAPPHSAASHVAASQAYTRNAPNVARLTTALAVSAGVVSIIALALATRSGPATQPAPAAAPASNGPKLVTALADKVAVGSAPTPAPTPEATSPSLKAVLAFVNRGKCEMTEKTRRIFTGLVTLDRTTWRGSQGPALRLPGFDRAVTPTFERRVQEGDGLNVRDNEATLPIDATWHDLTVIGLRYRFMEESSFWEMQVRFKENPEHVRKTLNNAGFNLPTVGSWKEVSGPDEVTEGMGVEAITGGAALTCGTSMYY